MSEEEEELETRDLALIAQEGFMKGVAWGWFSELRCSSTITVLTDDRESKEQIRLEIPEIGIDITSCCKNHAMVQAYEVVMKASEDPGESLAE